jgi:hypothetical protein
MINPISEEHSRIAYGEFGAELQGESEGRLFEAASAQLNPSCFGGKGLEVVPGMIEARRGAINV